MKEKIKVLWNFWFKDFKQFCLGLFDFIISTIYTPIAMLCVFIYHCVIVPVKKLTKKIVEKVLAGLNSIRNWILSW